MRSTALAHDQAGTNIGYQCLGQSRIGNGFLHGQPGIGVTFGHEAHQLAINQLFHIEVFD